MALINPSNLYSGGQVNLDTTPFVKFALNQEAQQKAKDEALDKYFGDKLAKVTSTGMRTQEIEPLSQLKNNIQNFYIQNKDKIMNVSKDSGQAWGQLNQMYNQADDLINKSKEAHKIDDYVNTLRKDPTKSNLIDLEPLNQGMQKHDQPIYKTDQSGNIVQNESYTPFDVNSITFHAQPYTAKEYTDYVRDITKDYKNQGKTTTTLVPTGNASLVRTRETTTYDQPTLKAIAADVENKYTGDRRLQRTIKEGHDLVSTPFLNWKQAHVDSYNDLNSYYKLATGKDITDPSQIHAAEVIKQLITEKPTEKTTHVAVPRVSVRVGGRGEDNLPYFENDFDKIQDHTYPAGTKIENGVVYDNSGNRYNGKIQVPIEKVPSSMSATVTDWNKDARINTQYENGHGFYEFTVEDGIPKQLATNKGYFDRAHLQEAYEKKMGIPPKSRTHTFAESGMKTQPKPTQIKNNELPLQNGKVNKSKLVSGKSYSYSGKNYKWDGKNLIEQ